MALDKQDLADLLASLEPTGDESEARIVLSESIGGYSSAAESAGRKVSSTAIDLAEKAMAATIVGISIPNQGSQKIVDGIKAFWVSIASNPSIAFQNASAITPPPFAGLKAKLDTAFDENVKDENVTLESATLKIAGKIDEETRIGGTVTFPDLEATFPII